MASCARERPILTMCVRFAKMTSLRMPWDWAESHLQRYSGKDSKACNQLQRADSLGADTVFVQLLSDFNSAWVDSNLYNAQNNTYSSVPAILDSLNANQIVVGKTENNKIKLNTVAGADTNYVSLHTTAGSLTFFFDQSISINLISPAGEVTRISNQNMPLETASGCTMEDENEIQVPFIKSRYEIAVPANNSLLQLIKNEQTKSRTIHVSIL